MPRNAPAVGRSRPRLLLAALLSAPFFTPLANAESLYSLKVTNDLLSLSGDGHYTSGVDLMRITTPAADHWSRQLAEWLPGWTAGGLDAIGYQLSHQLYTPKNIARRELIEDDRPYAGLLLGGLSLFDDVQHRGWREASTLNLKFGMVGPIAGGEPLQKGVHELIGSEEPRGWDHQLENEPIVNLGWHKAWWLQSRWAGLEWEYGPSASWQLGNLYDYLGSGGAIRFGDGLDKSFGIPSVAPALGGRQGFSANRGFGWYGFVGVEGRYMAHNLLLDGNTFEDSHSVERREWVGDVTAGAVVSLDRWQLAFTSVWRSHEFEAQDESDHFGSITLSTWL